MSEITFAISYLICCEHYFFVLLLTINFAHRENGAFLYCCDFSACAIQLLKVRRLFAFTCCRITSYSIFLVRKNVSIPHQLQYNNSSSTLMLILNPTDVVSVPFAVHSVVNVVVSKVTLNEISSTGCKGW